MEYEFLNDELWLVSMLYKKSSASFPFFRHQDSSADDVWLVTDDELSPDSSIDEDTFMEKDAHKHLPNDSDDSAGQLSSSSESNEMNRDIDLDEGDQWCAYSVDKADPLCYKFDDLIRRGLIPKNGILYKYLTDVIEIYYDRCH